MDLTLDEHKLVAEFRRLGPAGQKDLLAYAAILLKKGEPAAEPNESAPQDRCPLDQKEGRPEAVKEPIFTE